MDVIITHPERGLATSLLFALMPVGILWQHSGRH